MTGITDEDVAGKRIDDEAVLALLASVSLIVAHNAGFDRPFAERRIKELEGKWWACSMIDVPWKPAGLSSVKLEYLLIKHCNCFYGAHRADNDCRALIHLLASPFADGTVPMRLLLDCARRSSTRVWAEGAAYEQRSRLKARGYKWSSGDDGRRKSWYRDVCVSDEETELHWLRNEIFGGRQVTLPTFRFDGRVRYSSRV